MANRQRFTADNVHHVDLLRLNVKQQQFNSYRLLQLKSAPRKADVNPIRTQQVSWLWQTDGINSDWTSSRVNAEPTPGLRSKSSQRRRGSPNTYKKQKTKNKKKKIAKEEWETGNCSQGQVKSNSISHSERVSSVVNQMKIEIISSVC